MASYLVISEHHKRVGAPPSGLFFNKLMSLLHTNLLKENIDIKLPHCWYRYGDEVVRYLMPYPLEWNHEDVSKTTVDWNGPMPATLDEDVFTEALRGQVLSLVGRYTKDYTVEDAVREVYLNAPFEFQRRYRNLRRLMHDPNPAGQDQYNGQCMEAMKASFEVFPAGEFPDITEQAGIVEHALEESFTSPAPDLPLITELSDEFWNWFCYFLRLHPDGHQNVPRETLEYWQDELEDRTRQFEHMLGDHLLRLSEENLALEKDELFEPVIQKRRKELEEYKSLVDGIRDDFEGFDAFLADVKKSFKPRR